MPTRPSSITEAKTKLLVKYLKGGHSDNVACTLAGVHPDTFRYWCRRGGHERFRRSKDYVPPEQADPVFRKFVVRIEQAQATAEERALTTIVDAFAHDWRAAMTFLSRRYPDRWGSGREKVGTVLERRAGGVIMFIPDKQTTDDDTPPQTGGPA